MGMRPRTLLPRLAIAGFLLVLATATITFAAETRQEPTANTPVAQAAPTTLLVPDVRRQAYVFVKSTLEESGFAWRVTGSVAGYSANIVASQSPAPGRSWSTRARDDFLSLSKGHHPAGQAAGERVALSRHRDPASRHLHEAGEAGCAEEEGRETREEGRPEEEGRPARRGLPRSARPRSSFPAPSTSRSMRCRCRRGRAPDAWLTTHRTRTDTNVKYWLYQHAWVVAGAKLGWWRGAEALRLLLKADERVQRIWGIGSRSEAVARAALADVSRKSR